MRIYFTEANYKHIYEAMKLVGTLIEERGLTDELDGIHTSLWLILMKCERQREKKGLEPHRPGIDPSPQYNQH